MGRLPRQPDAVADDHQPRTGGTTLLAPSLTTMAQRAAGSTERWEIVNAYWAACSATRRCRCSADAFAKRQSGYDVERAYRYAAVNTFAPVRQRLAGLHPSDLCISHTRRIRLHRLVRSWQLAARLGKTEDAKSSRRRAAYRNIFDREKGWFRPRRADGSWAPWPRTPARRSGTAASNRPPYQQGWFVPHDAFPKAWWS